MDLQTHLSMFFTRIEDDPQINSTQICIYMALVRLWTENQQISPFQIKRRAVMQMSKINSRSTFSKSMKQLHDLGYIKYIPSFNPEINSMVCLALEERSGSQNTIVRP